MVHAALEKDNCVRNGVLEKRLNWDQSLRTGIQVSSQAICRFTLYPGTDEGELVLEYVCPLACVLNFLGRR